MVVRDHPALSLSRQCRLLSLGRSSLYYKPKGESAETLALMRRIDGLFLKYPFYGARRMALHLRREGVRVGRRRAARLMRLMGLQAIYRAPRTSAHHPKHRVYPYLLRGLAIERPNHVWCADITFYEATVVKRESGYVSGTTPVLPRSSGPELRIASLGTFLSSGARRVARTLLLSGRFPAPRRIRAPIPHAAGATFREMGPIYIPASFSPGDVRSHIRPAQRRPHPAGLDWQIPCRSGAAGAHRHETGLGEPPQCNEQLAGECHNHHPAYPAPGSCSALFEPFAKRTLRLVTQPAPRHLNKLSPDPGRTVGGRFPGRVPSRRSPKGLASCRPNSRAPGGCGTRGRRLRASARLRRSRRSPSAGSAPRSWKPPERHCPRVEQAPGWPLPAEQPRRARPRAARSDVRRGSIAP